MNELEKLKELTEVLTTNGYLKDQTASWEYAFNSVETSVIITNPTYKIKFVNDAFNSLIGVNRYHLINKRISSVLSGEIFSVADETVAVDLDNYFEFDIEFIQSMDMWIHKKKYAITDDYNKLVGYLFMVIDVTDREKALKKLHFILSASNGYSWEKTTNYGDDELTYVYADTAFCEDIFNMDVDAKELTCVPIIGKTFGELVAPFIDDGRKHTFKDICKFTDRHTIDQGHACEYIEMGYIEYKKGKPEWVIIAVKKIPLFNANGVCTGIICTTDNYLYLFNDPISFISEGIAKGYIDKLDCGAEEAKIYWIKDLQSHNKLIKKPLIHVDFP